jgi:hypothetical protein
MRPCCGQGAGNRVADFALTVRFRLSAPESGARTQISPAARGFSCRPTTRCERTRTAPAQSTAVHDRRRIDARISRSTRLARTSVESHTHLGRTHQWTTSSTSCLRHPSTSSIL